MHVELLIKNVSSDNERDTLLKAPVYFKNSVDSRESRRKLNYDNHLQTAMKKKQSFKSNDLV
jgi:hypothetical protein